MYVLRNGRLADYITNYKPKWYADVHIFSIDIADPVSSAISSVSLDLSTADCHLSSGYNNNVLDQ